MIKQELGAFSWLKSGQDCLPVCIGVMYSVLKQEYMTCYVELFGYYIAFSQSAVKSVIDQPVVFYFFLVHFACPTICSH